MQTENGLPQDIKAQLAPGAGGSPQATVSDRVRFEYTGTATEIIGKGILAILLTMVTFGFAFPWVIVGIQRYVYSRIRIHTSAGPLTPEFTGTGFLCFVQVLLSYFLVGLTFGIYMPWYVANVIRFVTNNSHAVGPDGTRYRLDYTGTGGELFIPLLVNMLLMCVTFGIYTPWMVCDLQKRVMAKTRILKSEQEIGKFDFVGTGGGLIGEFLIGMVLTMFTFGIYNSWFQCNMERFFRRNTGIYVGSRRYRGDFSGKGFDLFVIALQGLLIPLTFGIYAFWVFTKQNRFFIENVSFQAE